MPRKLKLNWDRSNKVWYKTIDGKRLYFGSGEWKYRDKASYDAAVSKYEEYMAQYAHTPPKKPKKTVKSPIKSAKTRPSNTIGGALDQYTAYHTNKYKRGAITAKRLQLILHVLGHFEKWLRKDQVNAPDGLKNINSKRYGGWYEHLDKRVRGDSIRYTPITWRTARAYFWVVKDFFSWAYNDAEIIDVMPRGFDRKKFVAPRHKVGNTVSTIKRQHFTYQEIQALLKAAPTKYPISLWILLSLNCGFTSIDISTLREEHIQYDVDGNPYAIEKTRKKTGAPGQWRLWKSTISALNNWLKEREESDKWVGLFDNTDHIFLNKNGRELAGDVSTRNDGKVRYHQSITLAYNFKQLVKTVLPDNPNKLTYKCLRKTGAQWIHDLKKPNSDTLEMLWLAHKPKTMARKSYVAIDYRVLDEAVLEVEQVKPL